MTDSPEELQTSTAAGTGGSTAASQPTLDDLQLYDAAHDQIDRSVVVANWLKQVSMWAVRLLVITVAGYVAIKFLGQFWSGVLPVMLALIVSTVLAPPTTWMRRMGLPSVVAALISVLGFFGLFGLVVALIAPNIVSQSQVLYLQALEGVQRLQLWAQGPPLNLDSDDLNGVINDIVGWIQDQAGNIAGGVVSGISTATSFVITLFMVLVLVIFFLKDGHRFLPWLRDVLGHRAGCHTTEVLTRSWGTLGGYVRAQAIVSAIDAIFIGLGLWAIGVPMALTLAIITFIAGFIPYVGAISAGALAVLVALVSLGFTEALLVLALIIAVQQLEGNILSPVLQSRAMALHPVIILVVVVVGGGLFGIIGAFLAVPVTAVLAVFMRYLIDMTAIHAGEKSSEDIEFVTPEGRAIGKLGDVQGRAMREQWREHHLQFDPIEVAGAAPETVTPPEADLPTGPTRRQRLTSQGADIFERTFGGLRRR